MCTYSLRNFCHSVWRDVYFFNVIIKLPLMVVAKSDSSGILKRYWSDVTTELFSDKCKSLPCFACNQPSVKRQPRKTMGQKGKSAIIRTRNLAVLPDQNFMSYAWYWIATRSTQDAVFAVSITRSCFKLRNSKENKPLIPHAEKAFFSLQWKANENILFIVHSSRLRRLEIHVWIYIFQYYPYEVANLPKTRL